MLFTSVDVHFKKNARRIDSKPCYDNCLKNKANVIYDANYREIK